MSLCVQSSTDESKIHVSSEASSVAVVPPKRSVAAGPPPAAKSIAWRNLGGGDVGGVSIRNVVPAYSHVSLMTRGSGFGTTRLPAQ